MLHPSVERELFGTDRRAGAIKKNAQSDKFVVVSRKQVAVVLLMMITLGSWALDGLHLHIVPRSVHAQVASMIDSQAEHLPPSLLPSVDTTVAHNPLDDSPITFGSVILLGIVCAGGLAAMAFSSIQQKPS